MFSNGRTVNGSKVSHKHNVDFHHLIPSQLTTRSHEILQIQHVFRFLTCENAPAIHLSGSLQVNELNINFLKLLQFYIIIPFLTGRDKNFGVRVILLLSARTKGECHNVGGFYIFRERCLPLA